MSLIRMTCLALVCLALGVQGEVPQSPWQSLNPKPQPAKQVFDQGQAIAQLALTMEEELLAEMIPFKLPFKMDKKQMAVVIRLLKKLVKPILKSERLRQMVSIVDDYMQDLEQNTENKKYYMGMLDAAQDVYGEVNRMYNSDEPQGRTISTIQSIYRESVLNNWFVQPFTDYVITPITSRISYAAERIYELVPNNSLVIDTEYYNPFSRWGETFDYYVNRISSWTAGSRRALETTARYLEQVDEASEGRSCNGCGNNGWGSSGDDDDDDEEPTSVEQ